MKTVRAISLDLDDTLWPIWPIIEKAEQSLQDFLQAHSPKTAQRFPIAAMRHLREHIALAHPELAHDFTAQRKLSLQQAFTLSGESLDLLEPAFDAFYSARNQVQFYSDCIPALEILSARWPLIAITNGNADLQRIGIGHYFQASICARSVGIAKPEPEIFQVASQSLGINAEQILHVGDDPWLDVVGAQRAGFQSAWINRTQAVWPADLPDADFTAIDLQHLLQQLDAE